MTVHSPQRRGGVHLRVTLVYGHYASLFPLELRGAAAWELELGRTPHAAHYRLALLHSEILRPPGLGVATSPTHTTVQLTKNRLAPQPALSLQPPRPNTALRRSWALASTPPQRRRPPAPPPHLLAPHRPLREAAVRRRSARRRSWSRTGLPPRTWPPSPRSRPPHSRSS